MAKQETVRLETLSEIFDIPLWTLRKWASQRKFPGIQKGRTRRVYVNLDIFRAWWNSGEAGVDTSTEVSGSE